MKEIKYSIKLQLPAKKATPIPPISTALGPSKINLVKFCNDFNNWSKDLEGNIEIGVIIYNDLSYDILSKKEHLQFERTQINESLSFLYNKEPKVLKKC